MSRYIDADKFGKTFEIRQVLLESSAEFNFAVHSSLKNRDKARAKAYARLVKEIINDQSTTSDVVEVVRCKDCIYYEANCCFNPQWDVESSPEVPMVRENDFCSYGERRENGTTICEQKEI